ncbi:MAG: TFIIB-type zinc ribbon-containing protein [Promethearchaeota archaeon]
MVVEIDIVTNLCPECGGSTTISEERGETVCRQCGLVVLERGLDINHSGIRAYSKSEKDKKERTGSPMSILMPDILKILIFVELQNGILTYHGKSETC